MGSARRGSADRATAARNAGVMTVGLSISRVLGIARDILLAFYLGTGHVADAWIVANRLPFYLVRFLTEGTLNPAFVPVVNEYLERYDRRVVRKLASAATSALGLFTLTISAAGFLAAPFLVHVVAPGFADIPGKMAMTTHLMRWTFGFLFLFAIAGVLMALLQSVGYFVTSAAAPAVFNIMFIVALVFICPLFGPALDEWVNGLLIGLLLAALCQIAIQLRPLQTRGMLPRPSLDLRHPGVRRMSVLLAPTLLGAGVSELAIVANTLLASFLQGGAMAAIEYASRIAAVPHNIVAGALSAAMLPLFSRQHARGERAELAKSLSLTLRALVFLMVPLSILTVLLSNDLIRVLLERGAFSDTSTAATATSLAFQSPLLLGASTLRILMIAFFSQQDTRTPVKVSAVILIFNVALGAALLKPMGIAGLSLALALTPCLGSLLLIVILVRRTGVLPTIGWRRTLLAVAVGTAALLGTVLYSQHLVSQATSGLSGFSGQVLRLSIPAALGLAAYVGVGWLARIGELSFIMRTLARRAGTRS